MMTAMNLNVADLSVTHENDMGHQFHASESNNTFATHVTSIHPAVMHHSHAAAPSMMHPMPPSFMASPSKNPCMVRVEGSKGAPNSRYRNDPYTCSVLPPLAPQSQQHASTHGSLATRRLAPLPPSLQVASSTNRRSKVKADIMRAQEFAVDGGVQTSPDSTVGSHQQILPAHPPSNHMLDALNQQHAAAQQQRRPTIESDPNYTGPRWAMVRLKHEVLLYNVSFPIAENDFVVLEGDRGENIGRVSCLVSEHPKYPVQCSVVRVADEADINAVRVQREKEEAAKHFAQGVSDALQLGIKVVDTEFQTDGNKLTIYFTSRRQIDFRRLQRQMFKQYRCRIWLVNWADVVKA